MYRPKGNFFSVAFIPWSRGPILSWKPVPLGSFSRIINARVSPTLTSQQAVSLHVEQISKPLQNQVTVFSVL